MRASAPRRAYRPAPEEGGHDLTAVLEETGLSQKAAWYSAAALFGGGGILVLTLCLAAPSLLPGDMIYLASVSVVIGAFCGWLTRRLPRSALGLELATHARFLVGLAMWVAGTIILQEKAIILSLIPMFSILTPSYMYDWRYTVPYVIAATSIAGGMVAVSHGPAVGAHTATVVFVFVSVSVAMMVTRERTRRLVVRNRELARTDALTGIANMRRLRERMAEERRRQSEAGSPFALFVMDLDNFKLVNDSFDHSTGDRVLRAVAAALSEELEPGDLAARRGGDEFALVARSAEGRDLEELRGRLRAAACRARAAVCPEIEPSATVAFVRTRPGEELGAMMERADQALHEARAGRRRDAARRRSPARAPRDRRGDEATDGSDGDAGRASVSGAGRRQGGPTARWLLGVMLRTNPVWQFSAMGFAASGLLIAVLGGGGSLAPMGRLEGIAVGAALVANGAVCLLGGVRGYSLRWLHVPWLITVALFALAVVLGHRSGTALLDLYPGLALYGVLMYKPRTAMAYLGLVLCIYGVLLFEEHAQYAQARIFTTTVVIAILGGIVMRLRRVTVSVARRNVELSSVDALTGMANVRALQQRLASLGEGARDDGRAPLLVQIDLDEFKPVNDTYSHTVGDSVLVAVGRAIAECVRVDELVVRRGGDEFAVVVNQADPGYAEEMVDRIGEAIVHARRRICPELLATASVAATRWKGGMSAEDLMHDADVALHEAKQRAYERARLAGPGSSAAAARAAAEHRMGA